MRAYIDDHVDQLIFCHYYWIYIWRFQSIFEVSANVLMEHSFKAFLRDLWMLFLEILKYTISQGNKSLLSRSSMVRDFDGIYCTAM